MNLRAWLFCCGALLTAQAVAMAQEQSGEPYARTSSGLRMEVDAVWPMPRQGYPYPIRIRLENLGASKTVECRTESRGEAMSWNVSRTLRLGEKERADFTLLVPKGQSSTVLRFVANGTPVDNASIGISTGGFHDQHLVIDRRKTFSEADLEASFGSETSGYSGSSKRHVFLPPDRLTDQWQAYAGLAGIWARADDWKLIAPAAREAILRAVKAGRTLLIYAAPENFQEFMAPLRMVAQTPWKPREGTAWSYGLGTIVSVNREIIGEKEIVARYGFVGVDLISSIFSGTPREIPGVGKPPRLVFLWITLAFALVLGPINLMLVHRMRKRPLFLVTTPLLSLVAVGTLFAYSAVHDGFEILGASQSVTLLDVEGKDAVIVSSTALYSGLSSGRWNYRPETLCVDDASRHLKGGHHYYSIRYIGPSADLDWSQGQTISGGWVPARTLRVVDTVQLVPIRSRLAVERGTDGAVRLHNGLGTDILSGRLNIEGRGYGVPPMADGASAEVLPGGSPPDFPARHYRFEQQPLNGEFLVSVSRPIEQDNGGKKIRFVEGRHLVHGTLTERR